MGNKFVILSYGELNIEKYLKPNIFKFEIKNFNITITKINRLIRILIIINALETTLLEKLHYHYFTENFLR